MPARREEAAVHSVALLLLGILAVAFLVSLGGVGPAFLPALGGLLITNAYLNQLLLILFVYWVWRFPQHLRHPLGWSVLALGLMGEVYLDSLREGPFRLRYPWFGGGLGLAVLIPLARAWLVSADRAGRFQVTALILQPLALIVSAWVGTLLTNPFGQSPPRTSYDLFLYHADLKMLGVLLAAELRRFSCSNELLLHWLDGVYNYLGLVMGVCQLLYLKKTERMPCSPSLVFIFQGFLVVPLYTLMPATGTVRIFGPRFPDHLPAWVEPQLFQIPAHYPTVCMPSMHTCWGLTCLYLLWPLGGLYRKLGLSYACFLLISVFSAGNHYLLDAFLAFPFTLGSCLLAQRLMARVGPSGGPAGLFLVTVSLLGILFLKHLSSLWSPNPWWLWGLALFSTISAGGLAVSFLRKLESTH